MWRMIPVIWQGSIIRMKANLYRTLYKLMELKRTWMMMSLMKIKKSVR